MNIIVIEKNEKGEMIPLKHYEELEVSLADISAFSNDRDTRYIGIGKDLYRLSLASYKEIKKELIHKGLINKFDYSKKTK